MADVIRIAVLLTCHNRADLTLAALAAIETSACEAGVDLIAVLTDDGSTDGTAARVRDEHPQARVLAGDGNLFWNRGMLRAWESAVADAPDFYLWLNDDLAVEPHAIASALATWSAAGGGRTIAVGRTIDPDTPDETTYGVYARASRISRLRLRRAQLDEPGVSMNGNFVLIPACAIAEIGLLDPAFSHSFGDIDYGLRASAAGYAIIAIERPVGQQTRNHAFARTASRMTIATARHVMTHPKGVPWREWLHFTRRHGGPLWPINFGIRYAKMLAIGTLLR